MRFNENAGLSPEQLDFIPRERRDQIKRTVVAFFIAAAIIFVLGNLGAHLDDASSKLLTLLTIMLLCFYVVVRKQQSLDLVTDTEYQNLLFSQAISQGLSFCLFVRRDGTIVYANQGLKTLFPDSPYTHMRALDVLFDQASVANSDRERIMNAIQHGNVERLIFPIRSTAEGTKDYILTVDPLPRPGGFSVLRAREYRGQRAGLQLLPEVLRATSADKLDHLLAHTPVAHYTTDPFGQLEYVNPAFEELLGYAPGELAGAKTSIQNLLYEMAGRPLPEDYTLAEYKGPAAIYQKERAVISVNLFQNLMRGDDGKVIGVSGSLFLSNK